MDRYIFKLFVTYFLGGLLIFMTLFVAIDAMSMMVNYKGVQLDTLLNYYLYVIPEVLYRMIPFSALIGTVFTLSILNKNNELVALHSLGMSLLRISAPVLFGVILVSGSLYYMSNHILPRFARQKNFIFYNEIKKNPGLYALVKTNKIWYRSKDMIFYLRTLNDKNKRAQGLNLYYFDAQWNLIQMIVAEEVEFNKNQWVLHQGTSTFFGKESSFPMTSSFQTKTISMGEEVQDLSATVHPSDVLSIDDLSQFIKRNKEAGLDTIKYEVDYQSKFSYPLSALVMSLLGIPFSVSRGRSGGLMLNMGICLGLAFLYWIFLSSSLTLGNHGFIPPSIAAWTPNLVMSLGAIFFIRKK